MTETRTTADEPEDVARLVVERVLAKDLDGLIELYEQDAVLDYPKGSPAVGRDAIREVYRRLLEHAPPFAPEEPLPTLVHGDIALTATRPADGTGGRSQVLRRQADGSWRRIIDRPET